MLRARTGDPALIREINLSIILNALRDHSATSRASLAATTGLTKATVSHLIQKLTTIGFVTENGVSRRGVGRPGTLLQLNPRAGGIIGVEIGVDFVSLLLTDFAAQVLWRHYERTNAHDSQATVLNHLLDLVERAVTRARQHSLPILGLAVGVPGLVNVEAGTLLYAPNLKWEQVPIRQRLQQRFDFAIHVDNEASLAAFGEMYFGVARGTLNMVYLHAGVGIGGGLVLNGRMYTGGSGFAAEVGHTTIDPDGLLCNCGNHGCWETLASESAVFRRIRVALEAGTSSALAHYCAGDQENLTIPIVVQAADQGDALAREALRETAKYLGIGIANLVNALNPEMVVVGGSLSLAKDYVMPVIHDTLDERALRWSVEATQLVVSANQSDACAMGGVAVIHDQILRHPLRARKDSARAARPRSEI